MIGFKGFNSDLKCRDKQYVIGETAEEPTAELCETGIHFCEHPLNVFDYYSPSDGSRYCEVESPDDTVSPRTSSDTKRVTTKLTIKAELTIPALVQAAVKFVFDRATWSDADKATGDQGAASATGYQGAASATGTRGAASATGYQGAASATGDQGAALTTGYASQAKTEGTNMIACALGEKSSASGDIGNWLVLAERDDEGNILGVQSVKVDGEVIKADTFYTLSNSKIIKWVEE